MSLSTSAPTARESSGSSARASSRSVRSSRINPSMAAQGEGIVSVTSALQRRSERGRRARKRPGAPRLSAHGRESKEWGRLTSDPTPRQGLYHGNDHFATTIENASWIGNPASHTRSVWPCAVLADSDTHPCCRAIRRARLDLRAPARRVPGIRNHLGSSVHARLPPRRRLQAVTSARRGAGSYRKAGGDRSDRRFFGVDKEYALARPIPQAVVGVTDQ